MTTLAPRLSALTLAVALMGGCATTTPQAVPAATAAAAMAQIEAGHPRDAALALESWAATQRGAARTNALSDAAWAWFLAGDSVRAISLRRDLNARHLSGPTLQRHQLLSAELALAGDQPVHALGYLAAPLASLPSSLLPRWLLARSRAQEASGDAFNAAASRIPLLTAGTPAQRTEQQHAIARLLAEVDENTLRQGASTLPAGDPAYNPVARALLARGLPLPRPMDKDPSTLPDVATRPAADADGYRPPARIAVLLPLSGQLATAAAPVRDGLLAGYYAQSRRRPSLDFIDTHGHAAGAIAAYEKATANGADYVIGPLGRDEVDALFARDQLPVPIQALNHGRDLPPPGHLAFSLAPEDDGATAADYLASRERRQALVIHSNDDTGRRAAASFKRYFAERGGSVVQSVAVSDTPADISGQLGFPADGVFLAIRAPQARLLSPQLALAGLSGALRVGSSQLTTGTGKPGEDAALDGIVFPTERWQTQGIKGLPAAGPLASRLPTARGAAARLVAFGYDAWQISAYPDAITGQRGNGLEGATGLLYLDGAGKVMRRPTWSTFSGGQHRLVQDGN